jgi:biotin synthase
MVGMGETEEQMISLMDKLWKMRVVSHLFSFFAEENSKLAERPQPAWPTYLRMQLARYLIEMGQSSHQKMDFDPEGRIIDFGLLGHELEKIIDSGLPFMTTGCLGPDGEVACNRPFGNCLPDVKQWNYPYHPNREEIDLIKKNILEHACPK